MSLLRTGGTDEPEEKLWLQQEDTTEPVSTHAVELQTAL